MSSTPDDLFEGVRTSTTALVETLGGGQWTDDYMRGASLLAGWTRGHVLTHIARNADGITRTLTGALRGEDVPRYPNGMAGRDADIEAGAGRPAADLVEDVRTSARRLDAAFAEIFAAGPQMLSRPADKSTPARWVGARWREVEIHRVDLAAGHLPQDWPPAFVAHELPADRRHARRARGNRRAAREDHRRRFAEPRPGRPDVVHGRRRRTRGRGTGLGRARVADRAAVGRRATAERYAGPAALAVGAAFGRTAAARSRPAPCRCRSPAARGSAACPVRA